MATGGHHRAGWDTAGEGRPRARSPPGKPVDGVKKSFMAGQAGHGEKKFRPGQDPPPGKPGDGVKRKEKGPGDGVKKKVHLRG